MTEIVKAVIKLQVPAWQIGQDVSVYFPDTMYVKGKCENYDSVKPTSGEWLYDRPHHFKCSVCNRVEGVTVTMYKYCPYCGSMMFLSETERRKEWQD